MKKGTSGSRNIGAIVRDDVLRVDAKVEIELALSERVNAVHEERVEQTKLLRDQLSADYVAILKHEENLQSKDYSLLDDDHDAIDRGLGIRPLPESSVEGRCDYAGEQDFALWESGFFRI